MLPYLFLTLYLIAAALNLTAAFRGKEKLFAATKPALLLLLGLYCLFSAQTPDPLLLGAFFACWLGDVLLMLKGNVWFILGGISFLAGHALLIVIFARFLDRAHLPFPILIPAAVLYAAAAGCVSFCTRKKTPLIMWIPMLLYLITNAATNVLALYRAIVSPGVWQTVSFAGAILFFLSDCALFLKRYGSGPRRFFKTDFFVMLTYISGVLLIALGLAPPGR